MKKLLVAIDDCESITMGSQSIQMIAQLARAFSSRVWLLHVVPEPRPAPFNLDRKTFRDGSVPGLHHEHQHLQELAHCLRVRGIDTRALLVEGPPVEIIFKKYRQLEPDLIVLVCRKHGSLVGALTGSPRERILAGCPSPIMYIPET